MLSPVYVRRDACDPLRSELAHVLAGVLAPINGRSRAQRLERASQFPMVNVAATEDAYILEAEFPGISRDALEISVIGNELTIKAERKVQRPENARTLQREISEGTFSRTLRFPTDVDADKVEALYKDGVLKLTLPKAAHARPRKININAH